MFHVAQAMGGLAVQLVFFRGQGEFEANPWATTPAALADRMRAVSCRSGFTQLHRVLTHAADEATHAKIGALVYVGDCFEETPIRWRRRQENWLCLACPRSCSMREIIPMPRPCFARSRG